MIWPKDVFTRFEVARLIGARALQIALGAPLLVESKENLVPSKFAKLEFKSKIIPITVKRRMPDKAEVVVNAKSAIGNWMKAHQGEI